MKTYSLEVLRIPSDLPLSILKRVKELEYIKGFSLYIFWDAIRDTQTMLHGGTIVNIIDDCTKTVIYQGLSKDIYSWINNPKQVLEWNVSRDGYYAINGVL